MPIYFRNKIKTLLIIGFGTLPSFKGLSAESQPARQPSLARQLEADFVAAFEKVAPAVVVIDVMRSNSYRQNPFDFFFPEPENEPQHPETPPKELPDQNQGSGVIIREDGYIVSNHHVVEGAQKITVHLWDGRKLPGRLIGKDPRADLAVIKIETTNLPAAKLGNVMDTRIGQWTIAIGAPFNLDYSYSVGWLSGKGRGGLMHNQYVQYLQTTAPINPGNSGGPLCNIDGEVIGINTLIQGIGTGLGFAVPVDMVKNVSDQLIAKGKVSQPWLGVHVRSLEDTEEKISSLFPHLNSGALVEGIEPGTPAAASGLQPFDIITTVDGAKISSASDLQAQIIRKQIGHQVKLTVERIDQNRKPQTLTLTITLEEMPALDSTEVFEEKDKPDSVYDKLGLEVVPITEERVRQFNLKESKGVVIMKVNDAGAGFRAGLGIGVVITAINHSPIQSLKEYQQQLEQTDLKKGILLFISKQGVKSFALLTEK